MHSCPYCKEHFEYKDILFFISRKTSDANATQMMSAAPIAQPFDPFSGSMDLNLGFGEPQPEHTEDVSETVENRDHIGEWAVDQTYYDARIKFWKAEATTEERFIVHWDPENASPGVAKATLMHKSNQYPTAVELCEEDQLNSGWSGSLSQAICPNCHFELPTSYLWVPDENCHSIALIGYPSSGKTQYKVSLVEELGKLRSVYNLVRKAEVFKDSRHFAELEGSNDGTIESTDANAVVLPMIFAIEQNEQAYLITLYDLPGEVYTEREEYEGHLIDHKGLRSADGAILMIDPVQLYSELDGQTIKDSDENTIEIKYVIPDTDIIAPLTKMRKFRIGESMEYMSIALAKVDLMIAGKCSKYFQGGYLRQLKMCHSREYDDWRSVNDPGHRKGHFGKVKPSIINEVDKEVMHVIDQVPNYDYRNIKQEICDEFSGNSLTAEKIRAFAISTLRRYSPDNPDDGDFLISPQTRMPRHRILEPLLYLLARWGVVESESDNWGIGAQNPFDDERTPDKDTPHVEPIKRRGLFELFKK